VLCVGRNRRQHAHKAGLDVPENRALIGPWTISLVSDSTPTAVPPGDPVLDWEVGIAAIVGTPLTSVGRATALAGIPGYAACNDLSARTHQTNSRLWTLAAR
jgi:2-keto-4-pentenoate hydratase/2-oxohepta-3-ene-1,7-dioic acid hydratase in catechol pathway